MKFQVAHQDINAALQVVSPAMASAGGEISSHFVFRPHATDPGKMEVLTYTGRVCAAAQFVATFDGDARASFTIEGWRLNKWLEAVDVAKDNVTLDFQYTKADGTSETVVTILKDATKKQYFPSLDPAHFPYWDKILSEATVTATLPGDRLKDALSRSKLFTAEDESKSQGLCVSEVRDGVLTSTNKSTLCLIVMPDLKGSKIRIHNKDVGPILTFLGLAKQDSVEVLEHDRTFFFRRGDGSYFGETRFHETFPPIGAPNNPDQYVWEISVEAVKNGLKFLQSGAAKGDDRLWVSQRDGRLVLKMESTSGGKQGVWDEPLVSNAKAPDADPLPENIQITVNNLKRLLDATDEPTLKLGANLYKKGGFFRYSMTKFADDKKENGDKYLVMIVWNKNQ